MDEECEHSVASDHVARREAFAGGKVVRYWRCAGCDKVARWGKTWGFFGKVECKKCGVEEVQFVVCSKACQKKARAKLVD